MHRRDFIKATSLVVSTLITQKQIFAAKAKLRKPNIILIMADDLGYGDLGCYGNSYIKTPNIDKLAKNGIRFTDYHSNGVVCTPTRAALLTGRYQQRSGLEVCVPEFPDLSKPEHGQGLLSEQITFAELLKEAEYKTALFGKWHLGVPVKFNPSKQGFEEFKGFVTGNIDYFSHVSQEGQDDWWQNCQKVPDEGYVTDLLTRYSLDFIEENKDKPFCLYLAHECPHYPWQGPEDEQGYKRKAKITPEPGNVPTPLGDRKDTKIAIKQMIENMDEGIGKILSKLRELGVENNTLIFLCSDNGAWPLAGAGSNGVLGGIKGEIFEGGHRVPAIAYWPEKIKPAVADQTVMTMDLFPTLMSITKTPIPKQLKLDGTDLTPILFDNKKLPPRTLFWRYGEQKAVRKGPWKLVRGVRKNPDKNILKNERGDFISLYNLDQDISENKNIALSHPNIVMQLQKELTAWEKDVDSNS